MPFARDWINMRHVGFGNKLRLHAEILSYWVNDDTFPQIQPSEAQSVSFEREQWLTLKSKIYTQSKKPLDENQSSKFLPGWC